MGNLATGEVYDTSTEAGTKALREALDRGEAVVPLEAESMEDAERELDKLRRRERVVAHQRRAQRKAQRRARKTTRRS